MQRHKFVDWLRSNGAQLLPETNAYEWVRFIALGQTCVIYQGRRGITAMGAAQEIYNAFLSGTKYYNMGDAQKPRNQLTRLRVSLRQRDGDLCFFCGESMFMDEQPSTRDATIEHLVARGKGGPDHQDNLVLAHEECNKEADNLPLIEKIKLRERKAYERHYHSTARPG